AFDKTLDRLITAWNDTMMVMSPMWQENGSTGYLDSNFVTKLGIGTTDAEAPLHVIGDVMLESLANPLGKLLVADAEGVIRFWNDTMMFVVSPMHYQASTGEMGLSFGANGVSASMSGGEGQMWAHIDIQHNIFNDTILVTYTDASVANILFEYVRVPHDGSSMDVIASYTTSGDIPGVRSHAMPIPGGLTTDLSAYSYYLIASSGNWSGNLSVRACFIKGRWQHLY
ncbi:MAG: hypothetical protein R3330_05580, partial [Saprospiraceae bacterium]|nr:hypothetical protein [Saprospiraceae bacterium]